jgi:hypothetical protein
VFQDLFEVASNNGAIIDLPVPIRAYTQVRFLDVPVVDVCRTTRTSLLRLTCQRARERERERERERDGTNTAAIANSLQPDSGTIFVGFENVLIGLDPTSGNLTHLFTVDISSGASIVGGLTYSQREHSVYASVNTVTPNPTSNSLAGIVRFDSRVGDGRWVVELPYPVGPPALVPAETYLLAGSGTISLYVSWKSRRTYNS